MSQAPSPSNTLAGIPQTSQILGQNDSPPSQSPTGNNPPPSDSSQNPSPPPPDSSSSSLTPPPSASSQNPTPPPPDSSSSSQTPPPSDSSQNSTPPPPPPDNFPPPQTPPPSASNTPSDSPPPVSNSPPPPPPPVSNSGSSPPPPPPPPVSNSGSSPPPPDSNSGSSPPPPPPPPPDSNFTPPPQSPPAAPPPDSSVAKPPPNGQSPSPPPDKASSHHKSPPKESPPPPPPAESMAPPPASTQPLSPLPKTPNSPNSPPQSNNSPPAPTSDGRPPANNPPYPPTPPGSKASNNVPELTPPTHKDSSSSAPSSKSGGNSTGSVAGVALAGLVIIAFVAIFFVVKKKKKKGTNAYPEYYGPPPPNYSGNAGGYYYGQHSQQHSLPHSQQHSIGMHSNEFHSGSSQLGHGNGSYRAPESGVIAGGLSCFSYEELMGITSGFSRQNVIGEGGFGSVYKGVLPDGRVVAVKELKAGSGQGEREFRAEVEIISRVHHRHLVSLVGYCIADSHRLLVYEFVSNSTLEHHLHGKGVPVMEWTKRMRIAVGSARGLAYLHEDCHPKIIHRDIKSANILIDDDYEAQVADFGLAKLSNDISAHVSTRVMGTFGYLAPEYAASGKLSDKSDVFSFGVVLLEIVTGRKPVDGSQPLGDESLVEWARPLLAHALETGDFSELIDPRLENRYVEDEMLRMITAASAAVRHSAPKRPRMVQVLRALDVDGEMPDLSNGVKVGQSTIFEVGKNVSDMQKFRMMAFGSGDSSEYQMQSGNFTSEEAPLKSTSAETPLQFTSGEAPRRPRPGDLGAVAFPSGESETRPINPRSNRRL